MKMRNEYLSNQWFAENFFFCESGGDVQDMTEELEWESLHILPNDHDNLN